MTVEAMDLAPYLRQVEERYQRSVPFRRRVDYAEARQRLAIDDKMILYTAFYGRGLCCNPYALFLYLKNDPRFSDFHHVWVLDQMDAHPVELELYRHEANVSFVEFNSLEYFQHLAQAKYVVNNSTELALFSKRPGQVLINTWHGIPLKTMGFDIPGNGATIGNTLRGFLMDDYLLSPDAFMTEQMYQKAYKLEHIFPGKIVEAGYPRFDTLLKTSKPEFIQRAAKYGVEIDPNKKLVLYAPTWKGFDFNNPDVDVTQDLSFISSLYQYLDPQRYQILFKPHQAVFNAMRARGVLQSNCVPANIDANELLSVTDILISDYSSIFFDFLVTGRPILFYIPDLEEYLEGRGLYFSMDRLPGPMTAEAGQLGEWLRALAEDEGNYGKLFDIQRYTTAQEEFVGHWGGHSCEAVVKAVFEGDDTHVKTLQTDKPRLLFHGDTLNPNGITESLLNLLNHLDYDRYDVTLYGAFPKDVPQVLERVNRNVRTLVQVGGTTAAREELARMEYCKEHAIIASDGEAVFPTELYQREYQRCLAGLRFDYIINFAGYSAVWANIYATEKHAKHLIWMHNDMQAEWEKEVDGVRVHETSLAQIFKHYSGMDQIVGCSKATMELNRAKLATPATFDKFTWVHNMLNIGRIEQGASSGTVIRWRGAEWFLLDEPAPAENGAHLQLNLLPKAPEGTISFIAVGRLSPEKNLEALIRAFARLCQDRTEALRLYLLGDGPLREALWQLVSQLGVSEQVVLAGNVSNPFFIEKHCQCFILPSLHEGMPMVLLEARTLGLPIVVSDFATVSDCLREEGQLLIHTDEDSIYQGMTAFLEGQVPDQFQFDPYAYNQTCLREFEGLLQKNGEAE